MTNRQFRQQERRMEIPHTSPGVDIAPRLQLRNLPAAQSQNSIADDVRRGLVHRPRWLPPKYFYDERGSWLFDQICKTREYYPTRTEDELLQKYARRIIEFARPQTIFELGSGASRKTVHLLNACEQQGCFSLYQPLDVCGEMLIDAGQRLTQNYEWLDIEALVGEYQAGLDFIADAEGPGLYVFLGGSIGNFTDKEATAFLKRVRQSMSQSDYLLLGADRVKSEDVLNAAYNDARGYTEAFNLNLLNVLNRELEADFRIDQFAHHAFFNSEEHQIEMHLRSQIAQTITFNTLDLQLEFAEGESIRTEISRKFTPESLRELLAAAGFGLVDHFQPENGYFSLVLARPSDA